MKVNGYEIEAGADLRNVSLQGANLKRADLIGADLIGANLKRADLERAYLMQVNLEGANLESVNLRGANFRGANFRGVNIRNTNLEEADLNSAIGIAKFSVENGERIGYVVDYGADVYFALGCFWGNTKETLEAVEKKYGKDSQYYKTIQFYSSYFKETK